MEPYQWSLLDSPTAFRLVSLQGYTDRGQIACNLITESIDKPPPYIAISYHWATKDLTEILVCDGKKLPITVTVHALFRHLLKNKDINKMVWIDAVCIDQTSPDERTQQVLLMKDIFSNASQTIVYLGEPDKPEDVPPMLDLCDQIIRMTKRVAPRKMRAEDLVECGLPPLEEHSWTTLAHFLCLPWFDRVWVMQEYVLAKEIVFLYGGHWKPRHFLTSIFHTLPLNDFSYSMESLLRPLLLRQQLRQGEDYWNNDSSRLAGISSRLSHLDYFREMRKQGIDYRKWALRMLLSRASTTVATDLRDHVFGLLGILPEDARSHPDLLPRYDDASPLEHAFTRLARFVLCSKGLASLLSSVGFPRRAIKRPSWVPDWSTPRAVSSVHRQAMLPIPHNYGQDETAQWRLDDNEIPKKLFTRGIVLGSIAKTRSILEMAKEDPSMLFHVSQQRFIWDTMSMMAESDIREKDADEVALRHLRAMCLSDTTHPGPGSLVLTVSELEETSKAVAPLYDFKHPELLLNQPERQKQISNLLGRLQVSDASFGFCLTDTGHIGRISHETELNDEICFFQGVDIPFVISQKGQNTGEYIIRDHCYVHGEMDGEFWKSHDVNEAKEICLV